MHKGIAFLVAWLLLTALASAEPIYVEQDDWPEEFADSEDWIPAPGNYVRTVGPDSVMLEWEGERSIVHLIGIDTPDLEEGTSRAYEAAAKLARICEASRGQMFSVVFHIDKYQDPHGNAAGWVYVHHPTKGDVLLQDLMVESGYAIQAISDR